MVISLKSSLAKSRIVWQRLQNKTSQFYKLAKLTKLSILATKVRQFKAKIFFPYPCQTSQTSIFYEKLLSFNQTADWLV